MVYQGGRINEVVDYKTESARDSLWWRKKSLLGFQLRTSLFVR